MTHVLEFDLDRKETPVKIGGEDYVLVELDGKDRDKYLNNLGQRVKIGIDGKPGGLSNFEGLHATLIAATLFKREGEARLPVTIDTIQKWPARVSNKLFDASKKLSGLDEGEGEEKPGND